MGKCLSCCHRRNSAFDCNQKPLDSVGKAELRTSHHKGGEDDEDHNTMPSTTGSCPDTKTVTANGDVQPNNLSKALVPVASEKTPHSGGHHHLHRIPSSARSSTNEKRCSRSFSENKIQSLFEHYKDPHENAILSEGIERLCRDLEVKPEEFIVLVLAWKFGAEQMCRFTYQEFVEGCKNLKVDSIQGIRCKFPEMLNEVRDSEHFKDLYRFTYKFGLEAGQRILPSEMAIQLWRLVFSLEQPPILHRWLSFLELNPHIRGIPRDTWNMFLNFCETVGDDLSVYDDTEAWPSLFDDFVECENDKTNQNVQMAKKDAGDKAMNQNMLTFNVSEEML